MNCDVKNRTEVMNAFDSRFNGYDCPLIMVWNEENILNVENDSTVDSVIANWRTTTFQLEISAADVAVYALLTFLCTKGRPTRH